MVQITIQIDGDKVTVNQSAAPTKVETSASKRYFIVMGHYDEDSWVNLVTENQIEAANMLRDLRYSCEVDNCFYSLLMQENGQIIPCNGTDWDIDRQSVSHTCQ